MNLPIVRRVFPVLCIVFWFLPGLSQSGRYDPLHQFAVVELRADFQFLRTTLEKTHPNLYLYTDRPTLNGYFDSLYKTLVRPLTEQEFYNLICLLNAKIKDGHTMFLPSLGADSFFRNNGGFFPFDIVASTSKMVVNMNCSADTSINPGAEILSINGIGAASILSDLLTRQIRDGNNSTYPLWIVTNYFKEYYSFSFGHPFAFTIEYRTANAKIHTSILYALSKDSIRFYRNQKYADRISTSTEKPGIALAINKPMATAELTIKSFDEDLLQSQYHQQFDSTVKEVFQTIQSRRIQRLILDLRNNQGGDFEPGRKLLSYLINRPMPYLEHGVEFRMVRPDKNAFKGKLYILINGGSFSSTGILCAYLDLIKRAVFIGEETGGNKTGISGNSATFILPSTKIVAEIAQSRYRILNRPNDGHGLLPTYPISPTIEDIISNKDPVKAFALALISKTIR